jgi:hypothetical protein
LLAREGDGADLYLETGAEIGGEDGGMKKGGRKEALNTVLCP